MTGTNFRYALMAAILVTVGMVAGFRLNDTVPGDNKRVRMSTGFSKIQEAISFVERNYVKEPNTEKMVDDAIKGILEGLDPHSFYISSEEMAIIEAQMQGSFEGIGIEFNILEDTLYVVAALSGGPSEKVGIQAGDRIIKIEDKDIIGITNSEVIEKLRGKKGTEVKLTVVRHGVKSTLPFTVVRDKIPLHSVDFSYMMNEETGYLKISRFAQTTHDEFRDHTEKLLDKGMKNMVLDLRGNPGGYMQMAEKIADEFLGKGKMVVYTDGRTKESKSSYKATSYLNLFEEGALVVLLDFGSASASEIVAGAIQDWDRGLIVGVRSFGKGMVQNQKEFADGSAMRLVTSQYYTPSGRCIQKPFDMSSEKYQEEIFKRFESGEIYDQSKIDLPDSFVFRTNAGRTVYGGGGILPDVFVSRDTTTDSQYLSALISLGLFRQYSYDFLDRYPGLGDKYGTAEKFVREFDLNDEMVKEFTDFAAQKGIQFEKEGYEVSQRDIEIYIKSFIGRRYFQDDAFYPIYHNADNVLQCALVLIPEAKQMMNKEK